MGTRSLLRLMLVGSMAAACSARSPEQQSATTTGATAVIVRGRELGPGSVLDGMRGRIPTMTIASSTGECPRIIFRGQRSIRSQGNPSVYVDNTLMSDTCVLTQIPAADVEYVEVIASGITSRPGIQRNPFGVILVYRLRAP